MSQIEELKIKVNELENKFNSLMKKEENAYNELIEESKIMIGNKIRDIFSSTIKNQPSITTALSREVLKELKIKMNDLIDRKQNETAMALDSMNLSKLLDIAKIKTGYYSPAIYEHDVMKGYTDVLGKLVGESRVILESVNFKFYGSKNYDEWNTDYSDSNPSYTFKGFSFHELDQNEKIKQYITLFSEAFKTKEKLDTTKEELSKLEAEDIWDSI